MSLEEGQFPVRPRMMAAEKGFGGLAVECRRYNSDQGPTLQAETVKKQHCRVKMLGGSWVCCLTGVEIEVASELERESHVTCKSQRV